MEDLNEIQDCEDDSKSIPVHCEVRWYGNTGDLRLRSDIVLLEVSSLITQDGGSLKLPSKGYGFNKPLILIELKLRRKGKESDNKFNEKIEKDRRKINRVRNRLDTNFYSYLIIFDKKKNLDIDLINQGRHKEYYVYPYEDGG
jgi:hypothetical protein